MRSLQYFLRLFSRIHQPLLASLLHEPLLLALREDGRIAGGWASPVAIHDHFFAFLRKQRRIFSAFDFGARQTLREFAESGKGDSQAPSFPLRPEFSVEVLGAENFFTDLPVSNLRIFAAGPGRFLGIVSFSHFLPNLHYANPNVILYLDGQERLRGYNPSWYALFREAHPGPHGMLGLSLQSFLEPTPRQFQEDYIRKIQPGKGDWEKHADLGELKPEAAGSGRQGAAKREGGKLRWSNPGSGVEYLAFPRPLDTRVNDYRLTVRARICRGAGPLLAAGAYQAGENAGEEGYALKKDSFSALFKPWPLARGEVHYSLSKLGPALFFEANGDKVFGFYDPHFLHGASTAFRLGLRPHSEIVVDEARLDIKKPAEKMEEEGEEIMVRAKSRPEKFYTLARFYNLSLSASFPGIAGYVLNEVTSLQEKVRRIDLNYQRERKRGEKLELLLTEKMEKNESLVGAAPAMVRLKEKALLVAGSASPVLIQGPTGTGKEVLARYIHRQGPRADKPFVKVDCSALPAELIESELFGYDKGAFTGAVERKIGRFVQADTGTLFLDEVGNLSLPVQAKLLGVLQDFTVTPLGGRQPIPLNLRLICATNAPLGSLIEQGLFRQDLFYRINTLTLDLPPLRERPGDIPLLCRHFIAQFNTANGKDVHDLTPAAYKKIFRHAWPGNVRELKNAVDRAGLFCEGELIGEELITLDEISAETGAGQTAVKKSYHLEEVGGEQFTALARQYRGRVVNIARALGISRKACYYNFKKFGIEIRTFRPSAAKNPPEPISPPSVLLPS